MQFTINMEAASRTALVWLVLAGLGAYATWGDMNSKNRWASERAARPADFEACKKAGVSIARPDLDCPGQFGVFTPLERPRGVGAIARLRSEEEIARDEAPEREKLNQEILEKQARYAADQAAQEATARAANADKPGLELVDMPGMGPTPGMAGRTPMVNAVSIGSLADAAGLKALREGTTGVLWLEAVNGKATPTAAAARAALDVAGALSVTYWHDSKRTTLVLRAAPAAASSGSAS